MTKNKKTPIVLVHGYRGAPLGFADVERALAKRGYEVYVPPMPPFGGAAALTEYSPSAYADYLAGWIKKEGLDDKKPVLVGHSMGSIIVAALAQNHPEVMGDKLILLAPIAKRTPALFRGLSPLVTLLPNSIISLASTSYLYIPQRQKKRFGAKVYLWSKECGKTCVSRKDDFAAAKFASSWAVSDFEFQKKTLFIAGEKDRITSKKKLYEVAEAKGAKVELLPETGHLLNYEQPEQVAESIALFVEN